MRIKSLRLAGVGPFEDTTIEFPEGKKPELGDTYLLVGENGCGKTTALHVLATLLAPKVMGELSTQRRFRGDAWFAEALGETAGTRWLTCGPAAPAPFSSEEAGLPNVPIRFLGPAGLSRLDSLGWQVWVGQFDQGQGGNPQGRPLSWAAFGYSGERLVQEVNIQRIEEIRDSPLAQSLGFHHASNSQRLAQWVANQEYKRLKAKESGQPDRAEAIAESVRRIEAAVGEIIHTEFRFHTDVDSLNVRVRLNGSVVDFGLLPAGVQSIVSWIADLLMRMDRLTWVDSLPVLQREFLLLLDEIDVHLHPAWQRKLLGVVQKLFPNAQIIASTHSPFVVASLADGAVIELRLDDKGRSMAAPPLRAPLEMSYSSTMSRLFGIGSDFDLETEGLFKQFQAVGERVLKGDRSAQAELDRRAQELKGHGEEIAQLVQFELNQIQRRLPRPSGT